MSGGVVSPPRPAPPQLLRQMVAARLAGLLREGVAGALVVVAVDQARAEGAGHQEQRQARHDHAAHRRRHLRAALLLGRRGVRVLPAGLGAQGADAPVQGERAQQQRQVRPVEQGEEERPQSAQQGVPRAALGRVRGVPAHARTLLAASALPFRAARALAEAAGERPGCRSLQLRPHGERPPPSPSPPDGWRGCQGRSGVPSGGGANGLSSWPSPEPRRRSSPPSPCGASGGEEGALPQQHGATLPSLGRLLGNVRSRRLRSGIK